MEIPIPFGYKMGWLAVRSQEPQAVAAHLGARGVHRATWEEGTEAIYREDDRLFITPAMNGWVLAAGLWVTHGGDESDSNRILALLTDLSTVFGEAQAFGTHRVVELHYWMRARQGQVERAFVYVGEAGEVLLDEGAPTAEELGRFEGDAADWVPEETDVTTIASEWSLDPTSLGSDLPAVGDPLLGRAPTL